MNHSIEPAIYIYIYSQMWFTYMCDGEHNSTACKQLLTEGYNICPSIQKVLYEGLAGLGTCPAHIT